MNESGYDWEIVVDCESNSGIFIRHLMGMQGIMDSGEELEVIPLSVFSDRRLGIFESAVKWLREMRSMSFSDIARLLNRDRRTVWSAYQKAVEKAPEVMKVQPMLFMVPVGIFSCRQLGPLEALSYYVHNHMGLSFRELSRIIGRNYQTVWLSCKHGVEKKGDHENKAYNIRVASVS